MNQSTRSILVLIVLFTASASSACNGSHGAESRPIYYAGGHADGPQPPDRLLTATGNAVLHIAPDLATVGASIIVEKAQTPLAASRSAETKKVAFQLAMTKLGLRGEQIKLSHLRVSPVHSPYRKGELRHIVGYSAAVSVTIELRDFDRMAAVIDAAAKVGATSIHSGFRSTKMTDQKAKVYEMALVAARKKAELMASTLGVKSIRVRSVAEGQGGHQWTGWGASSVANAAEAAPASLGGATEMTHPGTQALRITVTVIYEIV